MPPGTFIPELGYTNVRDAAVWLCHAFGFRERLRIANHRVQIEFGDGSMVAIEGLPEGDPQKGHAVMVRVADLDAHHARAVAAGARIIHPPTDYPYGERQYTALDLAGHRWKFSQSIADSDPADWGGEMVPPAGGSP